MDKVAQERGSAVAVGGGSLHVARWIKGSTEGSKKGAFLLWDREKRGENMQ